MSEGRETGDAGREARIDRAIDGAVREMLAVEPRADLQARVMARVVASSSERAASGSWTRTVAYGFSRFRVAYGFSRNRVVLAAAAAIILAVLVFRHPEPLPQAPVTARGVDQHLPTEARPVNPAAAKTFAPATLPRAIVAAHASPVPEPGRVTAAAVDESEDVNFSNVGGLSAPSTLEIERLQPPAAVVLPSFAPQPMTIRALEVTALPQTPRARREE